MKNSMIYEHWSIDNIFETITKQNLKINNKTITTHFLSLKKKHLFLIFFIFRFPEFLLQNILVKNLNVYYL